MRPDVITLVGGLNDTLRPKCDMGRVRGLLEEAVERLAPSCKQLVLMRSPGRNGPGPGALPAAHGGAVRAASTSWPRGTARVVVDLYGAPSLGDPRLWDVDRLHLTAEGHRRVAEAVWQALGLRPPRSDWQHADAARRARRAGPRGGSTDVRFARQHLLPWIGRRLTGRSSGDGRAGAQFDAGLGKAFWITPEDAADPGPVTGLAPAGRLTRPRLRSVNGCPAGR